MKKPDPEWARGYSGTALFYKIWEIVCERYPELSYQEKDQLTHYVFIFLHYEYTKHWEVNNHISKTNQWDKFNALRSLNDHGYQKLIIGITPRFFAIVCRLLEIENFEGNEYLGKVEFILEYPFEYQENEIGHIHISFGGKIEVIIKSKSLISPKTHIQANYRQILALAKAFLDKNYPLGNSGYWEVAGIYWREEKAYLDYQIINQ